MRKLFARECTLQAIVKIVEAQVRLPRIIHGGECFLNQSHFIEAEGPIYQAGASRGGVYSTRPLK